MRMPGGVILTALATSSLATLTAVVINIATSESAPPPLDAIRPYAYPLAIALWLLTAALLAAQEWPKHGAALLETFLAEPGRLDQAVEALRGRLDARVRRRVEETRLFPGLPSLPQVWRSDPALTRRINLATLASGTDEPADYVRTFDRVPSRRLVVSGAAGAGKSDWLHSFARGLIGSAEHRRAVPVLLDLSGWPDGQDFARWVTDHVVRQFPELRTRRRRGQADDLVTALLEANRLVMLLDGLDEVTPARRGELLSALNDELWHGQAVVLTTRTDTYPADGTVLRGAAAIVLEPLPLDAAGKWLTGVFTGPDDARWRPVLRALRDPATPVAAALATPLALTLAAKVYQAPDSTPGELVELPDADSVTRYLFDRFLPVVYAKSQWHVDRARGWLEYLATRMSEDDRHGIAWWRLYRFVPRWRLAILLGTLTGLVTGTAATGLAWFAIGPLPEHEPFAQGDFFARPWLAAFSMVENAVREISGQNAPNAPVVAVTIGAVIGAATAAITAGMVMGQRDEVWWHRVSWSMPPTRPGSRDVIRDVAASCLGTAAIGGALGALVGAFVGLTWFPGEGSSALFWLAATAGVRIGLVAGGGIGVMSGLFNESTSRWGRPAPDAPTGVRFRDLWPPTNPGPRGTAVLTGLGFAAGAMFGLVTGRHPGLVGGIGALLVLVFVVLAQIDGISETDADEAADTWTAHQATTPRAVLRADVVSSVIRVTVTMVMAVPLVLRQDTAEDRRYAGALAVLFVMAFLAREICVRSWSWSIAAGIALATRGRLPWRPLAFLEDARERQVLRREGGVYRFRHTVLQARLARTPPTLDLSDPPAASADEIDPVVAADLTERGERAVALDRSGHHRRATVELYRVLRVLRRVREPDDPAILIVASCLATALNRRGTRWLAALQASIAYEGVTRTGLGEAQHVEALRRLSTALTNPIDRLHCLQLARTAITDDDHRAERIDQDIIIMRGWATQRYAPSPHEEAEGLTGLLADACDTLGAEHRVTAFTRHVLAKALGRANRWAEAEEHYRMLDEWAAQHPDLARDLVDVIARGLSTARRHRRF